MNRRNFIKAALKGSALAGITTTIAYPIGKSFNEFRFLEPDEIEQTQKINGQEREQARDNIIANKLMQKYEISDLNVAKSLYEAMKNEMATYYATGALTGSAYRSINNEVSPSTRRNFFHRAVNVLAGSGQTIFTRYPIRALSDSIQDDPLTSPETLKNQYGLSPDNAVHFCEDYNKMLNSCMFFGAFTATSIQEMFISPPKDNKPTPRSENTLET